MKKRICCILCIMTVLMTGCTVRPKENQTGDAATITKDSLGENQFLALVTEIGDDYLMTEAKEGHIKNQQVQVWTGLLDHKMIVDIRVGDTVRITDRGQMTMSIPPQVSATDIVRVEK